MLFRILYPNRGDAMVQSASLIQRFRMTWAWCALAAEFVARPQAATPRGQRRSRGNQREQAELNASRVSGGPT
jgi:hypothetical protein